MSNKIDVGISATDAGFTSTIKKVNDSTKTLDNSVKKVAGNVTASFGSMVKAGAALAVGFGAIKLAGAAFREVFENFGEALDLGGELNDLASRTGETAGNILVLQRAFDNAGSSAEKVGPSINKMQKFLDDAAQGAAKNTEVLGRLGVSMVELEGKTPTEQMQLLAERISAIQDPLQRGALAMAVFGKSGGELLPLLRNFSGELETAQSQLGAMPGVIDRSNAAFDTISDNISVIQTKFRDLAAGLLDRLAPALEFATTMLTRFDAAALGMKIGDILIGAGEGMKGFTEAMKALGTGDLALAWDIAFTSMKLSAAESFNSILNNAKAAFSAIGAFIKAVLGPDSGVFSYLSNAFDMLGLKMSKSFNESFMAIVSIIPGVGEKMANEIAEKIKWIESDIETKSEQMSNALGQVPTDLVWGLEDAKEAFDKTLEASKDFINTQQISKDLAEKIAKIKQEEKETTDEIKKQVDYTVTRQDIIKSLAENIADYEEGILQAKKDGNKEREVELGKQKAYAEELKRSLELGLSMDDAIKNAKKAQADHVKEITGELKEQTAEMAKQLNFSQDMLDAINQRKAEEEVDPKGRLREKFAQAEARGDISGMERVQRQMDLRQQSVDLNKLFGEVTGKEGRSANRSIQDMAKELGIERGGKSSKELRDQIKQELEQRKQQKDDPTKKGEKEAQKADKQTEQANALKEIVQKIHDLCAKIEPKLPQTALGY
jgi:hypothetical protein